MTLESLDRLRELAADINATEIIDHMTLYPSCTFDGHWLDSWHMEFGRLLDAIQAEIDSRFMELPLDAEGVPIRVGNTVEFGENRNQGIVKAVNERMVIALHTDCDYTNYAKYGLLWSADACRHVTPRTIEDVLADFADELHSDRTDGMANRVERLTAKYATEIRELTEVDR